MKSQNQITCLFCRGILVSLLLLLPYTADSITTSGKYIRSGNQYTRDEAKAFCSGIDSTLATILSAPDQHDARVNGCPGEFPAGCHIGLTLSSDTTPPEYVWDDESAVTSYGFLGADATMPDTGTGPWFTGEPSPGDTCIRLDADLQESSWDDPPSTWDDTVNQIWADSSCDDIRKALCNVPTPRVELWNFGMHFDDENDINEWIADGTTIERPIITLPDRCNYRAAGSSGGAAGSILLDNGCWSICNVASGDPAGTVTHFCSTTGYHQCQLQYNIDPWSTSTTSPCSVEITNDDGTTWHQIGTYSSDDMETQFVDLSHEFSNAFGFGVRFVGPVGGSSASCCYFNEITLRCNPICTETGNNCSDGCQCCQETDVCRTFGDDDDDRRCQECIATGLTLKTECDVNTDCCHGADADGVICGITKKCCITKGFGDCSDNDDCCGDLQCKDDNICGDCIATNTAEQCMQTQDCCDHNLQNGIVCGVNNRCCISKDFQCADSSECCDGLTCNTDGICECDQCSTVDLRSTDTCSTSLECCNIDTIGGIVCGKENKCCITQHFQCDHSYQCCDDLICDAHLNICTKGKHHGRGHGHGVYDGPGGGGGGNNIHYAKQEQSVADNSDNNIKPIYSNNDLQTHFKFKLIYSWIIVGFIVFIILIICICHYYKERKQKKKSSSKAHLYIKTDLDDIDVEDIE